MSKIIAITKEDFIKTTQTATDQIMEDMKGVAKKEGLELGMSTFSMGLSCSIAYFKLVDILFGKEESEVVK